MQCRSAASKKPAAMSRGSRTTGLTGAAYARGPTGTRGAALLPGRGVGKHVDIPRRLVDVVQVLAQVVVARQARQEALQWDPVLVARRAFCVRKDEVRHETVLAPFPDRFVGHRKEPG